MPGIPPNAVLTEQMEARLNGRRLLAAVFLTFRFEPEFFEQEVLPVFLGGPVSHVPILRLEQLGDTLRGVPGGVAVYYDQNGLVTESGPAKLDVKRIPLRHRTAIFHPKNVFALVEEPDLDSDGHRRQALVVAAMSANLTRAGWWHNVEVCHLEEIAEEGYTSTGRDLLSFLERIEQAAAPKAAGGQTALRKITDFLGKTTERVQRSASGVLHVRFYDGRGGVSAFLKNAAGRDLKGLNLEVISPYIDDASPPRLLLDLEDNFNPPEIRVYLPRDPQGSPTVSEQVHGWVRRREGMHWGRLPAEIMRAGRGENIAPRMVHAKVYRFFSQQDKRELLFVGSANLTTAAHSGKGNLESGFLVEVEHERKSTPDWWLIRDTAPVSSFATPGTEDEGVAASGTRLSIRYWWDREIAESFWDADSQSPALKLAAGGIALADLGMLEPKEWRPLPVEVVADLGRVLKSTSILTVLGEGEEPRYLLVQEEGMHRRPSLLLDLSPAEILRYWALLTQAQKAAFIEARAPELEQSAEGSALVSRYTRIAREDGFFDRFAGIFLAFGSLERGVADALTEGRVKEATYRLFGQKYDSLSSLLSKVQTESTEGKGDAVDHYVLALCAQQALKELKRAFPDFWQEHRAEAAELEEQVTQLAAVRERLIAGDPGSMPGFLEWFDSWFLRRAKPVEATDD